MARVVKEDFTRRADDEAMNEHMKEVRFPLTSYRLGSR